MKTQVKTIDIQAKEWFDKVNGNSYFSARVTLNFGMKDETTIYLPFQYGYGSQYEQQAREELRKLNIFTPTDKWQGLGEWCREAGVILRRTKEDKCLKREVKEFGEA